MKKCKSCKAEIPSDASKCSHCSATQHGWFRRHPILTVLLVLFVLFVIGSIAGGGKSNTSTQSGSSTTASSDNKQDTTEKQYGLNEQVQADDLGFTVTNVTKEKSLGSSYTQKNAQGEFYVVTLKIENKGKKTVTFDSSMAKVMDSKGREFERSIEGQTAKGMAQGNVDLFLQQIQPSLTVTGDVVFDLPADITDPILVVKGSYFGQGAKIKLQ